MRGRLLCALLTGVNQARPFLPKKERDDMGKKSGGGGGVDAIYCIAHSSSSSYSVIGTRAAPAPAAAAEDTAYCTLSSIPRTRIRSPNVGAAHTLTSKLPLDDLGPGNATEGTVCRILRGCGGGGGGAGSNPGVGGGVDRHRLQYDFG